MNFFERYNLNNSENPDLVFILGKYFKCAIILRFSNNCPKVPCLHACNSFLQELNKNYVKILK